jgi:hypothetical protein
MVQPTVSNHVNVGFEPGADPGATMVGDAFD